MIDPASIRRAFGLALGFFYDEATWAAPSGSTRRDVLGFRAIFALWACNTIFITAAVNSRPPNGEDRLAQVSSTARSRS